MDDSLSSWFDDPEFGEADDLFAILEGLQEAAPPGGHGGEVVAAAEKGHELRRTFSPRGSKRRRVEVAEEEGGGGMRVSHITVERNRRKQMNEHLSVLRSLMPCFYVKRGDQASIIGGVVNYINELQQILQSLESKKQRKAFNEVLSPRPLPLSPRKPPLSPRINLPLSPRTPQPGSPYTPRIQPPPPPAPPGPPGASYRSSTTTLANLPLDLSSPCSSSTTSIDSSNELVANSKSSIAEVKVKFSGPNLLLKTVSPRIPGQVVKIVSALEDLSLEILQLDITSIDDAMLYCFTIKIGIECQVSAEELALQVQQTFC